MDFGHKGVEMHAAFAAVRQAAVKHVHQKAFAAAYPAVKIQAFGQLRRTQAAAEKTVALAFEHHQFRPQLIEALDGFALRSILNKTRPRRSGLIPGERAVVGEIRRNESFVGSGHIGFLYADVVGVL